MKKVNKLIALGLLGAMLLSGCTFRTVGEMYRLPKRSEVYQDLQSAIDAAMTNLDYCAPLAGEQRQTVQMADLDGDKDDEYLLFAKGSSDLPMRILIFDEVGNEFIHIDTIESGGTGFDQVEYVQMDAMPGMELVVGRQLSDQVLRSLSVYTFSGGQTQQLVSTNYSKFITANLDKDSYYELVVIRPGQAETDRGIVELYSVENANVERSVEVNMSEPVDKLKRILLGKLHDGQPAVYIASTVGDSALITDVYALVDGVFSNVSFSNESGTSVQTMRNYYVYAEDIDSDGVVELPSLINMEPLTGRSLDTSQNLIRWYAMTIDGGEVDKLYTYHNFVGGWYLEMDKEWASRITVVQRGNDYSFYLWDTDKQTTEKIMTVSALTGQNRQEQSTSGNHFVLYSAETVIYTARLEDAAAQYNITPEGMIRNFHLIRQDWKTGET